MDTLPLSSAWLMQVQTSTVKTFMAGLHCLMQRGTVKLPLSSAWLPQVQTSTVKTQVAAALH